MGSVLELWCDDWPRVEAGDGMPTRPPKWTGIAPDFSCVAGTTCATVTWDARVVGCGCLLRDDDWSLRDHDFGECWRQAPGVAVWRHLSGNARCRSCGDFGTCGGGCRSRAVGAGLTIDDPDPWAC